MHIKVNDIVSVIAGASVGTRTKVLRIDRRAGKVVVEGVNRVYKHVKKSQKNPQGGRLSKEMPISISNVLLFCDRCGRGVRTGARATASGGKERFCRKCGTSLGIISSARSKPAQAGSAGRPSP